MAFNPYISFQPNKLVNTGVLGDGFTWGETINVTLTGVTIVFAMLVLLVFIILVFGYIMNGSKKEKNEAPVMKQETAPAPAPDPVVTIEDDSDEIIAVISAAVASIYEGTGKKPVIRAIRRSSNKSERSAWATAGIIENTRAF